MSISINVACLSIIVTALRLSAQTPVWSALGSGGDADILTMAVAGANLYAGGNIQTVGGVSAQNIAKWDGSSWSALGSGLNGEVTAVAVVGTNLYAAGFFSRSGSTPVNRIARWDGRTWSRVGSGSFDGDLALALASDGTNLFLAGHFSSVGGVSARNIAKWDGTAWSALGFGLGSSTDGIVNALLLSGTDLYAGGNFINAGVVSATNIAKWDGSAWSSLGSGAWSGGGFGGQVIALAASGSNLYAGGFFTNAGGVSATNIAKWDGSEWSALGPGLGSGLGTGFPSDDQVYALAVSGTNLYAGGIFAQSGEIVVNSIARWDGNAWAPMGAGVFGYSGQVATLAANPTNLFVGGDFAAAGGVSARGIAKVTIGASNTNIEGGHLYILEYSGLAGISILFRDATPGQHYRIQASSLVGAGDWTDLANFVYATPVVLHDPSNELNINRFYRAVSP